MAVTISVEGKVSEILPEDEGKYLSLKQLQNAVGGFAEIVPCPNSHNILIVNEEGTLQKLFVNEKASKLAQIPIVGNVILCVRDELRTE